MLFEGDRRSSPRMIDIADNVEAGQGKLIIFHLLQKDDIQIDGANKRTESI